MQKSKELSDKDSESSFSLVFDQETLKEELREDKQEKDGESSDDEPIILTRKKKLVTKQKEEEDGSLLAYDSNDELEINRNAFKGKTYSKYVILPHLNLGVSFRNNYIKIFEMEMKGV